MTERIKKRTPCGVRFCCSLGSAVPVRRAQLAPVNEDSAVDELQVFDLILAFAAGEFRQRGRADALPLL
jgi:hypothetical protein